MAEIQLVIFRLNKEEYGINIMKVQEIGPYQVPVKVPNSPEIIEGIINLRGAVIPMINLKKRFGMVETTEVNENNRLIVVSVGTEHLCFTADEASEVMTITDDNIEEPPAMITAADRKYISGVAKIHDRIMIVLDLDALFSEDERKQLVEVQ